jgi:hypothetical protein
MYIPKSVTLAQPTAIAPRPAALDEGDWSEEETRAPRKQETARKPAAATVGRPVARAEEEPSRRTEEKPPRELVRPRIEDDDAVTAEEEPVEASLASEKPKRHFSWLAVLFLFLGLLSLGAVAGAPYLAGPDVAEKTGTFANWPQPTAIPADYVQYVMAGPGIVAFLAFLSLLFGVVGKNFNFFNVILLFIALLGSSVLMFCGLEWLNKEATDRANMQNRIDALKEKESTTGNAVLVPGQQYPAIAGGAAGACLFFTLAGMLMYRRWWSRMLAFFFLVFWPVLVTVWVFRTQLGIDAQLPFELPFQFPPPV